MTKKLQKKAPSSTEIIARDLESMSGLSGQLLHELTARLGVPREVVANDEEIEEALRRLPRVLHKIPSDLRDEKVAKACVAVACGLFDAAINYVWNAAIVELRSKVRRFGLHVIPQILDDRSFDEQSLVELKDADLLILCHRLNLITDQDFFFLDQCRATRNSYSVAHPAPGDVDEDEVLNFISRCQKHALSSRKNPTGVDTKALLTTIQGSKLKEAQKETWEERLRATFDAQRELLFAMLHGIASDPEAGEQARQNALSLCEPFKDEFTPKTQSLLVDRHQEYKAKGDESRHKASLLFFQRLGLIDLLGDSEIHAIITSAARNLLRVHNGWDNFYNEPPFAERLMEITQNTAVPESAQGAFVEAVVTCGVGNTYGVSRGALGSYQKMVRRFSPREIKIMLTLPEPGTIVAGRIRTSEKCRARFSNLVGLLDENSVPTSARSAYAIWLPSKGG